MINWNIFIDNLKEKIKNNIFFWTYLDNVMMF